MQSFGRTRAALLRFTKSLEAGKKSRKQLRAMAKGQINKRNE